MKISKSIINLSKTILVKYLLLLSLLLSSTFLSCSKKNGEKEEWISLFNGRDLTGWQIKFTGHELNDNYKNTFRVEDGILKASYDEYEIFDEKFGHIYTDKKFSNYILRLEYRFTGEQVPGGPDWGIRNNGIMFHSQSAESMRIDQEFPVSIETQLLAGNGIDERTTGNVCTPGTNVVINGELVTEHCIESTSETYHGDQWVTAEVEVHGSGKIIHRINGDVVFEYEKPQLDPEDEDAKKMIDAGADLLLSEGHIALQAESHNTEFRKIELLELEEE
jgi:hypothetical protein